MRIISYLLILLLSSLSAFCQQKKISVAIMPFTSNNAGDKRYATQIQETVLELLSSRSSIIALDRSKDEFLEKELTTQIGESVINSDILVKQGKKLGANQLILGSLASVSVEEETERNNVKNIGKFGKLANVASNVVKGTVSYQAFINFSLQLVNVETGKIISTKVFSNKSKDLNISLSILGTGGSKEEAIMNAIKDSKLKIAAWLNENFSSGLKIEKIESTDKKGNPKEVLVSGIDNATPDGSKFIVEQIEMIGDKKRFKEIATIQLVEKQGEIFLFKVIEGAEDLGKSISDNSSINFKFKN